VTPAKFHIFTKSSKVTGPKDESELLKLERKDESKLLKMERKDYRKARKLLFYGARDLGERATDKAGLKKDEKLHEVEKSLADADKARNEFVQSQEDHGKLLQAVLSSRKARYHAIVADGMQPHRRVAEHILGSAIATFVLIGVIYVASHILIGSKKGLAGAWTDPVGFWVEIGCWATFGACTYGILSLLRHLKRFDRDQRFWFWANMFWAPMLAIPTMFLLTYFGVNLTGNPGTNATANATAVSVNVSLWQAPQEVSLAIAFILGFFSRRTYFLLLSFRDRILPPSQVERDQTPPEPPEEQPSGEAKDMEQAQAPPAPPKDESEEPPEET